ncbi:MAG: Spx/MgsR family RNA polymerase-binding regulatory protein [Woeseiaceae bacterium]|nr:Spx/MgsR family RNA polymerase-binding regulatory protein [Woeseiaceae bacterium]
MTKPVLHGLKNCDTCRKARAWLEKYGVAYRYVDVRDDGLDLGCIERWAEFCGWESLVNRRSRTWRQLPEKLRDELGSDNVSELLVEHPTLLKRPVLEARDVLEIGFSPARYAAVFGKPTESAGKP